MRILCGTIMAAMALAATPASAMNHNLLAPWANPPRCSSPQTPLFVDAARRDFRFRDTSAAAKIGFRPFDFSRAGMYAKGRRIEPIYDTSYERQLEEENEN